MIVDVWSLLFVGALGFILGWLCGYTLRSTFGRY